MARNLIPSDATHPGDPPGTIRASGCRDGDGLFLLLFAGAAARTAGASTTASRASASMLSLGTYPDTSLALARRKADAARQLLAEGFDPSQQRKAEREACVRGSACAEERQAQGLPAVGRVRSRSRASGSRCEAIGWSKSYGDKIIDPAGGGRLPVDRPRCRRPTSPGRSCWR